jgi:hypothetical protein
MRIGLWRTSMYKDDGVYRGFVALERALKRLGHEVVTVGAPRPNVTKFDGCDVVFVYEAMWNWGKKTDPTTVLEGVRRIGPERCILGVNCPLDSLHGDVREPTLQLLQIVPRVWTNSRHRVAGYRDDAFVSPYILHWPEFPAYAGGASGVIATGRIWDKRKRLLLPIEHGYRGGYTLCGSLGLFGGWVRKELMAAGAEMVSAEPSSGSKPWMVTWPGYDTTLVYEGKYKDFTMVPWHLAKVHFAGVEAEWVGDPGLLETVTIEAMDAGLNVVVPVHSARPVLGYNSIFTFEGDDPTAAIEAAMESPPLDHSHDLALHDPLLFARRLLAWSWTPHEYPLAQ